MSPRYEMDLTKDTAAIVVLEKGRYEFAVGEPRSFSRNKRDEDGLEIADQLVFGVRFPVKVTNALDGSDPSTVGKRTNIELYIHTDGARGFAKQFIMAALGYQINEAGEDQFNQRFAGGDWAIVPETQAVGDVWREATGKRIVAEVDVQVRNDRDGVPTPRQQWKRYAPVSQA